MKRPDWATHEGMFCGIVPIWLGDVRTDSPTIAGKGWFADRVLMPVTQFLFSVFAAISGYEEWPLTVRELKGRTDDL
jgi:hypothetical protein